MSRYQRWECWTLWTLMAIWLMGSSVMRCSFISLDRSVGTGSRETADGREDAVDVRQGGVLEVGGEGMVCSTATRAYFACVPDSSSRAATSPVSPARL